MKTNITWETRQILRWVWCKRVGNEDGYSGTKGKISSTSTSTAVTSTVKALTRYKSDGRNRYVLRS